MAIIGITGGIGSGKSVISSLLRGMGYEVIDADSYAKWLMQNDCTVREQLKQRFGEDVFVDGQLNRRYLADSVFSDEERLQALNAIVHPAIKRSLTESSSRYNQSLLFFEAAILIESGFGEMMDAVITVTAPVDLRIRRVMQRSALTREQIVQRINNQWSDEMKLAQSDFVIVNNEQQALIPQVEKIVRTLQSSLFSTQ